jgi:hypothetical protein
LGTNSEATLASQREYASLRVQAKRLIAAYVAPAFINVLLALFNGPR